jgi:HlyD family secretion protein
MRLLRIVLVVALLGVGVGAVVVVLGGIPSTGANASTQYLTAAATMRDVTQSAAATGNVSAAATYSLTFGSAAQPASSAAASSSSSSSSSSNSSSNTGSGSSITWPVTGVSVNVGDSVTTGQTLATADPNDAQLQLKVAQANLDAANSKLSTDKKGPDATTRAAARDSVTQAETQLSQARQSATDTERQNAVSLSQARSAVTRAKDQLATDRKNGAPAQTISGDKAAITQANQNVATTEARNTAANHSAENQVTNASNGVTSARDNYNKAIAPATAAQIATDESAVASAQSSLAVAKTAVANVSIVAPVAGVVTAVNIVVGANAPSGAAISLASADLQVTADFSETDLPSLKVGQPATVTIKAVAGTAVDGVVSAIAPQAASSSGGVVAYAVTIALTTPPAEIRMGMSAQVTVTLAQSTNVIAVPTSALGGSAGAYTVQVLDSNGQPQPVTVQVGLVTNTLAEITSGLSVGQRVVTGTASTRTGTTTTGTGVGIPGVTGGGGAGGGRFGGGGGGGGGVTTP